MILVQIVNGATFHSTTVLMEGEDVDFYFVRDSSNNLFKIKKSWKTWRQFHREKQQGYITRMSEIDHEFNNDTDYILHDKGILINFGTFPKMKNIFQKARSRRDL